MDGKVNHKILMGVWELVIICDLQTLESWNNAKPFHLTASACFPRDLECLRKISPSISLEVLQLCPTLSPIVNVGSFDHGCTSGRLAPPCLEVGGVVNNRAGPFL
jgi:hypothetical protein